MKGTKRLCYDTLLMKNNLVGWKAQDGVVHELDYGD